MPDEQSKDISSQLLPETGSEPVYEVSRLLIYRGTAGWLRRTLKGSGVTLNGQYNPGRLYSIHSYITSISPNGAPCLECKGLTSNTTLICDDCYEKILSKLDGDVKRIGLEFDPEDPKDA